MSEQQGAPAGAQGQGVGVGPAWFTGEGGAPPPTGEQPGEAPEVASELVETRALALELEPEEAAAIADAKAAAGAPDVDGEHYLKLPPPRTDLRAPDWARIPPAPFRFPRGVEVGFVRIRGHLTAARHKGDRILVIWGLADGDEKLAYGRALGDSNRAITELAKQTIRAIDGVPSDWSGAPGPGNVDALWRELGGKGRGQIIRLYTQMHVYDQTEQADFFDNCVALVATG